MIAIGIAGGKSRRAPCVTHFLRFILTNNPWKKSSGKNAGPSILLKVLIQFFFNQSDDKVAEFFIHKKNSFECHFSEFFSLPRSRFFINDRKNSKNTAKQHPVAQLYSKWDSRGDSFIASVTLLGAEKMPSAQAESCN